MSHLSDASGVGEGNHEFEETLSKLADLAKGRVKFEEFTQADRHNLLDLFVNNERTLLKIYEVLFSNSNNFKQAQILGNPSDSIQLNDTSNKKLVMYDTSMLTQDTNANLSIDQSSEGAMLNNTSPSPYRLHDSSFAIEGDLNQDSQLQGGTQMSGQIMFNTPSNVLPNILPALGPGA